MESFCKAFFLVHVKSRLSVKNVTPQRQERERGRGMHQLNFLFALTHTITVN